jgi:alcohol dehydrogenase class IV
MVFAKETGDALASLVKEIDKLVADNKDNRAASFVNIIGEDREKLEETAKKFGERYENVAIVVPVEYELGPKDIGVSADAGVTVMVYKGLKVSANHAIAPGKLDDKAIKAIIDDAKKTLEK